MVSREAYETALRAVMRLRDDLQRTQPLTAGPSEESRMLHASIEASLADTQGIYEQALQAQQAQQALQALLALQSLQSLQPQQQAQQQAQLQSPFLAMPAAPFGPPGNTSNTASPAAEEPPTGCPSHKASCDACPV